MLTKFTVATVKTEKKKVGSTPVYMGGKGGITFGKNRQVDDYQQFITDESGRVYRQWTYSRKPEPTRPYQVVYAEVSDQPNGHGEYIIKNRYTKEKLVAEIQKRIEYQEAQIGHAQERIASLKAQKEKVAA